MQQDLFGNRHEETSQSPAPLAARMRPRSFVEFVGQEHLTGTDRVMRKSIEADRLSSMIFWGPPGTGKTTLAEIIASLTSSHFTPLSAVAAGVADLRKVVEEAKRRRKALGQRTVLFIDEIHRFNKAQQDVILPYVEAGVITMIGATTENPSFEVNAALLSRSRVFTLKALSDEEVKTIVLRALADEERGLAREKVELEQQAIDYLVSMANGDARVALNALELAVSAMTPDGIGIRRIGLPAIEDALQQRSLMYDKAGEEHFNIISALHKTMRGSDPDGALYWLGRMLEAGEDPLYVARRVVRFASEDVGMADPQALVIAVAAQQAVNFIGMPEGSLALAQAVVYMATAPKSNSLYTAYGKVREDVQKTRNDPVPLHLRNAVTPLMKGLDYGKGYKYAHDFEGHYVEQQGLPDAIKGKLYYEPTDLGYESEIRERLERLKPGRDADH